MLPDLFAFGAGRPPRSRKSRRHDPRRRVASEALARQSNDSKRDASQLAGASEELAATSSEITRQVTRWNAAKE